MIPPRTTFSEAVLQLSQPEPALNLVLVFNDEATLRWRKHMHEALKRIPAGAPDIEPGDLPGPIQGPWTARHPRPARR